MRRDKKRASVPRGRKCPWRLSETRGHPPPTLHLTVSTSTLWMLPAFHPFPLVLLLCFPPPSLPWMCVREGRCLHAGCQVTALIEGSPESCPYPSLNLLLLPPFPPCFNQVDSQTSTPSSFTRSADRNCSFQSLFPFFAYPLGGLTLRKKMHFFLSPSLRLFLPLFHPLLFICRLHLPFGDTFPALAICRLFFSSFNLSACSVLAFI